MKKFFTREMILHVLTKKKIYLFGAASSGVKVALLLQSFGFPKKNLSFIDSNKDKIGKKIFGINVYSIDTVNKNSFILISSSIFYEIIPLLKKKSFKNFYYFHDALWPTFLNEKYPKKFLKIFSKVIKSINISLDEAFTIYDQLNRIKNIKGDVAEVGVYKGGSAYLICSQIKHTNRKFYLFDTFSGLPISSNKKINKNNINLPVPGWLNDTNLNSVKTFLLKTKIQSKKLKIIKGIFPESIKKTISKKFSFVHLDTDLFESTYDSLTYFYPKLTKDGSIVSHDYNSYGCPGVKLAFNKFVKEKRLESKFFQISQSQCLIIK